MKKYFKTILAGMLWALLCPWGYGLICSDFVEFIRNDTGFNGVKLVPLEASNRRSLVIYLRENLPQLSQEEFDRRFNTLLNILKIRDTRLILVFEASNPEKVVSIIEFSISGVAMNSCEINIPFMHDHDEDLLIEAVRDVADTVRKGLAERKARGKWYLVTQIPTTASALGEFYEEAGFEKREANPKNPSKSIHYLPLTTAAEKEGKPVLR